MTDAFTALGAAYERATAPNPKPFDTHRTSQLTSVAAIFALLAGATALPKL